MADHADIEFFWDPICPFAWQTSRWIRRVAGLRGLTIGWRFINLSILNEERYDDADLQSVAAVISLEEIYGERSISILPWFLALLAVAGVSFGWVRLRRVRKVVAPSGPFRMPDSVSAFTVIGLLEQIDAKNGLNSPQREELRSQIDELEGFYFREGGGETPDLRRIAESWIGRASRPTSPR